MDGHSGIDEDEDQSPPLSAAADLAAHFGMWVDYLRHEKRFSKHTLRAYVADIREFCLFLTRHFGRPR